MRSKIFILFLFVLLSGVVSVTKASDVREFDPTKVLVDTDTGTIVFMPRVEDYEYALTKAQLEAQKELILEDMKPTSIKDKIFGKCPKR